MIARTVTELLFVRATLATAGVTFAVWATLRLELEYLWLTAREPFLPWWVLDFISDPEIHSLWFRPKWDFVVLPATAFLVCGARRFGPRPYPLLSVLAGLVASTVCALGMMYYPALILSGRIPSGKFRDVNSSFYESILFALITLLAILALYVVACWVQARVETPETGATR